MIILPIENILPDLRYALKINNNVILSADPGAGKTSRVPIALLEEPWLKGKKIIMLEPRRLAAVRSAEFMASQRGERIGETIGFIIRGENKIGKSTRIEVVTEGILTRMIQNDASLPNVGLVIIDEFHERSIHADLGLAFTLDIQKHLRNDLRILIMSATLDGISLSAMLGNAPIIKSEGKMFPVETIYLNDNPVGYIEALVVQTILRAVREQEGDILVFLPGQKEIRKAESVLSEKEILMYFEIHTLHSEVSADRQRAALTPSSSGKRKIILSTSIAETSLTIDGVRVVIDSGLSRSSKFDPQRGMSGLVTISVSQATADQRRGRAGRQQSGVCYRLWSENQHSLLAKYSQPEILSADLVPLALELARWGDGEGKNLKFLDSIPIPHFVQAKNLLQKLGALNTEGILTKHGKNMVQLPVHPRFANMLIHGKERGLGSMACDVAAILEEKNILRGSFDREIDLSTLWNVFKEGKEIDRFTHERIKVQSNRLKKLLNIEEEKSHSALLGILLALVYPERVAKKREGKYQLAGNSIGVLPKKSLLSREEYLAIGDVDGIGNEVKIFLAEPISEREIQQVFADQIEEKEKIFWDEKRECVVAKSVQRFGAIEISEKIFTPDDSIALDLVIEAIHSSEMKILTWDKNVLHFQMRSEFVRLQSLVENGWPNLSNSYLYENLQHWLSPYLNGIVRRSQLSKLNLETIFKSLFSYTQLQELEQLAPTHYLVPTGSRILIDYSTFPPILAVRLQEMFGETETPMIGKGKIQLLLHLLSPARRPLAVTQDLRSFWNNAYKEVRKDMRGQYPKHYWPENPLEALPTKKTKRFIK